MWLVLVRPFFPSLSALFFGNIFYAVMSKRAENRFIPHSSNTRFLTQGAAIKHMEKRVSLNGMTPYKGSFWQREKLNGGNKNHTKKSTRSQKYEGSLQRFARTTFYVQKN